MQVNNTAGDCWESQSPLGKVGIRECDNRKTSIWLLVDDAFLIFETQPHSPASKSPDQQCPKRRSDFLMQLIVDPCRHGRKPRRVKG